MYPKQTSFQTIHAESDREYQRKISRHHDMSYSNLILHKNEKGMSSRYTTVLGDADINISDMTNKSRGEFACTLMDVDAALTDEVVEKLKAVDGVLRVRVIK